MLSFLYLWTIKSIIWAVLISEFEVVNCFHFCIFELSKASAFQRRERELQLWIAFIFVSLNYQKHLPKNKAACLGGCELLSFLYLWTIKSIFGFLICHKETVVNCFHFCIFELSKASDCPFRPFSCRLWIAFIFVSLNYQKHLQKNDVICFTCCELLSFLYLWTIKSIVVKNTSINFEVVNCFHFCIFELSKASVELRRHALGRCELLSFLYLWTIKSIKSSSLPDNDTVVNCFHFCIFELSKASINPWLKFIFRLWIAFIFVSLNYQKHRSHTTFSSDSSCELLSFLYLWTIKSIEW